MPHLSVEYSSNLDILVDMGVFCDTLREAAIKSGIFPLAGVRVRATRCDHCSIADGDPQHGFIDIEIRLRAGRPLHARVEATNRIFAAAKSFLQPLLNSHPLALSMEMREIDPMLSPKTNSIRKHLADG